MDSPDFRVFLVGRVFRVNVETSDTQALRV